MFKFVKYILFLVFVAYLQGCLNVETKEYLFELKKDGSGKAKIRFINIMTDSKDSANLIEADYRELIDNYLKGNKLDEEFPKVKNIRKRLLEEDNQLVGELTFEFDDLKKAKFYKYGDNGPWCYYLGSDIFGSLGSKESFFSSNGEFGGENMPLIFWDGNQKKFEFKTTIKSSDQSTRSLIDLWKKLGEN
jgi:hypothetical protein